MTPLIQLLILATSTPTTTIAGVKWETSMAAAQARAAKEHKPILLMQMMGRLDDAFC